jgi:hypothetical protein
MNRFVIVIALLIIPATAVADSDSRNISVYGMLGLEQALLSASSSGGSESKFKGSGVVAEAGMDMAWKSSGRSGFNIALVGASSDFTNTANSETLSEIAGYKSYGAKAGFYFRAITFGGGFRKISLKTVTVSSGGGSSQESIEGQEGFAFLNLTYLVSSQLRMTVELSYGQGTLESLKSQSAGISLKFGLQESLK